MQEIYDNAVNQQIKKINGNIRINYIQFLQNEINQFGNAHVMLWLGILDLEKVFKQFNDL